MAIYSATKSPIFLSFFFFITKRKQIYNSVYGHLFVLFGSFRSYIYPVEPDCLFVLQQVFPKTVDIFLQSHKARDRIT